MNFWKGTTLILTGYVLHEAYPLRFAKYRPGPTIGDTIREIVNRKLNYIFLGSEYPKSMYEHQVERRANYLRGNRAKLNLYDDPDYIRMRAHDYEESEYEARDYDENGDEE